MHRSIHTAVKTPKIRRQPLGAYDIVGGGGKGGTGSQVSEGRRDGVQVLDKDWRATGGYGLALMGPRGAIAPGSLPGAPVHPPLFELDEPPKIPFPEQVFHLHPVSTKRGGSKVLSETFLS